MRKDGTIKFKRPVITVLAFFILMLFHFSANAQSPYLSVFVKMDSAKAESTRYKIEMKICEPQKMSERGDWFTPDSSAIDFSSLKPGDISCEKYIETEKTDESSIFNQFKFANQVFAWEKILVFKISNASSRGWWPEMYIVLPVRYKAFVTSINLSGIEFQSGKLMFVTDPQVSYRKSSMSVNASLAGHMTTEVNDSPLRILLEE